jgi:hypothetical protein
MDLAEEGPGQKASSGNLVFANRTGTLLGEITKSSACPGRRGLFGPKLVSFS